MNFSPAVVRCLIGPGFTWGRACGAWTGRRSHRSASLWCVSTLRVTASCPPRPQV